MADNTAKTPFERLVRLLAERGVEFIVIGGRAETLHGSARVTFDTDLCYRRTAENLRRLAAALGALRPTLRGAPPDLPFRIDAESLALGCNYTFRTGEGDLDLLGFVEPLGGYDELDKHAETMRLGDTAVRVIGLDDLIRIREHLGRRKDRDSVLHLRAIRRLRDAKANEENNVPPPENQ
jgi:predicted nucleotidyltransferase